MRPVKRSSPHPCAHPGTRHRRVRGTSCHRTARSSCRPCDPWWSGATGGAAPYRAGPPPPP